MELRSLGIDLEIGRSEALLATFWVRPILIERVQKAQAMDERPMRIIDEVKNGARIDFSLQEDGVLMLGS